MSDLAVRGASPDKFVLFVDMMAFGDLVEAEGENLDELVPGFEAEDLYVGAPSLLAFRFTNFHRCVQVACTALQKERTGTAVVFSDSAFLVVDTLPKAVDLSRTLMRALVQSWVPTRIGIAQGTFRSLRFASDTSAQTAYHAAQFLGTGVVRAYKTERCGIPGVRAFLHPALEPLISEEELKVVSVSDTAKANLPVMFEINYMDAANERLSDPEYDDCLLFDGVSVMLGDSVEKYYYHYISTYHAFNSMRAQRGRTEYPWEKFLDRSKYMRDHGFWPAEDK